MKQRHHHHPRTCRIQGHIPPPHFGDGSYQHHHHHHPPALPHCYDGQYINASSPTHDASLFNSNARDVASHHHNHDLVDSTLKLSSTPNSATYALPSRTQVSLELTMSIGSTG